MGEVSIIHGNCLEHRGWLDADVLITDPPYGIAYSSGARRIKMPSEIVGDSDTAVRDEVLRLWGDKPALVFGSWKMPRPPDTKMLLIWDTKGALGMGDLSLPWKPSHQEIYVLGGGFTGHRDSDVLTVAPVQAMAVNGRQHPHQKPVQLMEYLLQKCPEEWTIADPFAGAGSTLVAAKLLGRKAIGVEIDENYCHITKQRLAQGVLLT